MNNRDDIDFNRDDYKKIKSKFNNRYNSVHDELNIALIAIVTSIVLVVIILTIVNLYLLTNDVLVINSLIR